MPQGWFPPLGPGLHGVPPTSPDWRCLRSKERFAAASPAAPAVHTRALSRLQHGDPNPYCYHPKSPQPVPSPCSSREGGVHTQLSPCDDLKGRQLHQFLQILGVLRVLQILAILRGRRRGLSGLFFLGHGGPEAWESLRERRGGGSGPRPGGRVPSSCQQLNLPGGDRKRIWQSSSVLTRWPTGFITRGPSPRLSRSVFFKLSDSGCRDGGNGKIWPSVSPIYQQQTGSWQVGMAWPALPPHTRSHMYSYSLSSPPPSPCIPHLSFPPSSPGEIVEGT